MGVLLSRPPALPEHPYFLEKTTWRLFESANEVREKLETELKRLDIDFQRVGDWALCVLVYNRHATNMLDGRFKYYLHPDGGVLLEWQTRFGDRFLASDLCATLCLSFGSYLGEESVPVRAPFSMKFAMDDSDGEISPADLAPIYQMVSSPYADVQEEGLKVLVSLCEYPQVLRSTGAVQKVIAIYKEGEWELNRLLASFLNEYFSQGVITKVDMPVAIPVLMKMVCLSAPRMSTWEMQRRALSALVQCSMVIPCESNHISAIRQMRSSCERIETLRLKLLASV